METNILLHPGYPKCGSSWLQRYLFTPEHGFSIPWPNLENKAIETFCWSTPSHFDVSKIRREFFDCVYNPPRTAKNAVISHEVLVGDPILGFYWGFETAEKLAKAFPEARVFLCCREQRALLFSAWSEYIRRGGVWTIDNYGLSTEMRPGYRPLCPKEFLCYDELIAHYVSLFGEDRVLCLPIELLSQRPDEFVEFLFRFIGIRSKEMLYREIVYPGLGGMTLRIQRLLNHFVPSSPLGRRDDFFRRSISRCSLFLNSRLSKQVHDWERRRIKRRIQQSIGKSFAENNQRLQRYVPTDLQSLGYPI